MYFSLFPVLPYDVNGDGRVSLVTNLMKRVRVRANVKKELALLQRYPIQDGESPEMVADRHFGHTHYHWIILLLNGITDPYHDWPKSQREMQLYLNNKYGTRLNDVHHYEISQTSGDTTIQIEVDNTSYPSGMAGWTQIGGDNVSLDSSVTNRNIPPYISLYFIKKN